MLEVEPTPGEKLFILRKRCGLTAHQMRRRFKVGNDRYLLWEKDRFHNIPVVEIGPLDDVEKCIILRRRYGMGVVEVAAESGLSTDKIMNIENRYLNRDPRPLVEYWEKKTSE